MLSRSLLRLYLGGLPTRPSDELLPVTRSPPESSAAIQMAQRILELKGSNETDAEFARRLGLSAQKIANYRAGGGASVDALATILTRTDANPRWLVTGEGPQSLPASERGDLSYASGAAAALGEVKRHLEDLAIRFGSGPKSV